jgi:hypothetical protein
MKQSILILQSSMFLWTGCVIYEEEHDTTGEATTFVLCEGNFGSSNAALWSFSPDDATTATQILGGTSLGDVGQSLTVYGNQLYVIVNNSHKIEIFTVDDEISHEGTISFNSASPRYLVIDGTTGYVSCWNLSAILILDLPNLAVIDTISISGMPEFMILDETSLYASIPSNSDWSSASSVMEFSTSSKEIIQIYETVSGPSDMELIGSHLFVASTYYGANWSTYTGLSKIDLSAGTVTTNTDILNSIVKGDLVRAGETLYRATSTGLAPVNVDLSLDLYNIVGEQTNVYSAAADGEYLYFGTTDYVAPDTVYVTTHSGEAVNQFIVGAMPGDFAIGIE